MALWLVAPARMISSMIGRTLAANRLALAFPAAVRIGFADRDAVPWVAGAGSGAHDDFLRL